VADFKIIDQKLIINHQRAVFYPDGIEAYRLNSNIFKTKLTLLNEHKEESYIIKRNVFNTKNKHLIFDKNKVKVADVRLKKRFTVESRNNVLLQISNQEYVVYGRPSDLDFEIRLNHQLVFRMFKHDTDINIKRSIYVDDNINSELMIAVMFAIILVDDYAEGNN